MNLTRYELDNGLKVILHVNHAAPVVACNVWVGVGSADEEPREAGLAHVHEHMLFKGTARRAEGQIAAEVEAAGGHINAFTSFDQTCYYVVMSSRYLDTGLDILSDAVRQSAFESDALRRELEVIQEEIKRSKDDHSRQSWLKLYQTAYSAHPYRLPVIGTEESVDSFTRDDVVDFFRKHYRPGNMALVLVGDFEEEAARRKIERLFGQFDNPDAYERQPRPAEGEQRALKVRLQSEEISESHLRLGFHTPPVTHEDIPALDLLSVVMGYGEASHLYQVVHRERELVNNISAGVFSPREPGLYQVGAEYQLAGGNGEDPQTRGPSCHEEALRAVLEEVFLFREKLVDDEDLARARALLESQQIYGKETVERLAMKLGRYHMETGDPTFEQVYYERLAAVEVEDLRRVARAYLRPETLTVVLFHPQQGTQPVEEAMREAVDGAWTAVGAGQPALREHEVHHLDVPAPPTAALPTPPARVRQVELDENCFYRVELEGGPTLIVQEDHSVETFSIRALMPGGLRRETEKTCGTSSLVAELVTKGSEERSATEIARAAESMASFLSGMSGRNTFGLALTGLSRFFAPSFGLFCDSLLRATLPAEEFERERRLQIQGLRARRDRIGAVNFDLFTRTFFAPHPYALPMQGTEASLEAMDLEALRNFWRQTIRPRDMVLAVVGDVDAAQVQELVEAQLAGGDGGPQTGFGEVPGVDESGRPRVVSEDMEKNQAHLTLGFPGSSLRDEHRYTQSVLYAILSGQGGRLFLELRDKQSLAYSIHASSVVGLEAGAFTFNIGTSPEKLQMALDGMLREVERLRQDSVTAEELARAKRYLIGNHDIGLQRNSSRAMSTALDELYGLGHDRSMRYGEYIEEVEREDVDAFVQEYLDVKRALVSVVKPAEVETPRLP